MRHPDISPEKITQALGIEPRRSWRADEPCTPRGTPLTGSNPETYWTAEVISGQWPSHLNAAIHDALRRLARHRSFLHQIRAGSRTVELFIGWFFDKQSGDVLTHQCLALAGDLKIDLSFDVYPLDQPQNDRETNTDTSSL